MPAPDLRVERRTRRKPSRVHTASRLNEMSRRQVDTKPPVLNPERHQNVHSGVCRYKDV